MLSILIPVYNYNCYRLVRDLHFQAENAGIEYEIIVMDDASTVFFHENGLIDKLSNCHYLVSSSNLGRATGRNALARESKYPYLLFIDCDAEVCRETFIQNYISEISEKEVVCGGCTYPELLPSQAFSLRWTYGRLREGRNAVERNADKFNSFTTFNFLIFNKLFFEICFDENLKGYGHEDTLFGQALLDKYYTIRHIDNPLIHTGLDTNDVYIAKTEEGVRSLLYLFQSGQYSFLIHRSRLLLVYNRLIKLHLKFSLKFIFLLFRPIFRYFLTRNHPSMRLFDFYKLGYLCSLTPQN